jgi:hypothetical protein
MPEKAQQHPQVQVDVAQARRVVAEHVAAKNNATSASQPVPPQKRASLQTEQISRTSPHSLPTENRGAHGAAAADGTMIPWSNNPDGKTRTIPEALDVFRENMNEFLAKNPSIEFDLKLLDQISFQESTGKIMPEGSPVKWAEYGPFYRGTGFNGEITWKDLYDGGKIKVMVDPRVLASDQAILGILAHEMYEIQSIRDKMRSNSNKSLPHEKLQLAINDFHTAAVRLQNRLVNFMKAKSTQSTQP